MKLAGFIATAMFVSGVFAGDTVVPQPPTEQGESWTKEDLANTEKVLQMMRAKLVADTGDKPVMNRDAHAKHHGCPKAHLSIDNKNLDEKLRVGLFAQNGTYESIIRFSNGSTDNTKPDINNDVRGFALKVMGVPYQSYLALNGVEKDSRAHDFVFMNSPVFFIKDSDMYVDVVKALNSGGLSLIWTAIKNPKILAILAKATGMDVYNPLDIDFHSATPYKLGETSMRLKLESCKEQKDAKPENPSNNFLAERLASHLEKEEGCFDFYVQPNRDPKHNKLENPMKSWSTKKSPYVKVGRLTVLKQTGLHTEARNNFCENLSFNPWRSHPENRPMGAVNRARLEVYLKQALFRQDHNKVEDPFPTSFEDMP